MRTAITIGIKSGKTTLLCGPEISIGEQVARFKKIPQPENDEFDRVELWESGFGISKAVKLVASSQPKKTARKDVTR